MSQLRTFRPRVRYDLDVKEVSLGLLVYDEANDRVHYLSATAAAIFSLCTGELDEHQIAQLVADAFELDHLPVRETARCLADFRREDLLV